MCNRLSSNNECCSFTRAETSQSLHVCGGVCVYCCRLGRARRTQPSIPARGRLAENWPAPYHLPQPLAHPPLRGRGRPERAGRRHGGRAGRGVRAGAGGRGDCGGGESEEEMQGEEKGPAL